MANAKHLKILKQNTKATQRIEAWNEWRQASEEVPDLRNADLSEQYLLGIEFHGAALSGANLSNANLGYAVLSNADLSAAKGSVALIHSPRAGRRFAELVIDRGSIAVAAISEGAAEAVGDGWQTVEAAAQPCGDALLALAASLCKKPDPK